MEGFSGSGLVVLSPFKFTIKFVVLWKHLLSTDGEVTAIRVRGLSRLDLLSIA